jgi:two-component system, sensor histidine kinase LadS
MPRIRFFLITFYMLFCIQVGDAQEVDNQKMDNQKMDAKVVSSEYKLVLNDASEASYPIPLYQLQFYEDKSRKLSFKQIIQKKFVPFSSLTAPNHAYQSTFFNAYTTYWLRFDLETIDDKARDWILFLGFVSHAEVYTLHQDGSYDKQQAGFFVNNRKLNPNEGASVKAKIHVKPAKRTQVWVKFSNRLSYPPELNVSLQSYRNWREIMSQTNLVQGFFQGLLWLMLLYNLFLFLSLGDRTYFHFVLYVFFTSIFYLNEFGYLEKYLIPDYPEVSFYLQNLIYVAFVFYIFFNRSFLKIQNYPRWNRIIKVWLYISVWFMLLCFPLHYWDYALYIPARLYYHLIFLVALAIFIVIVLWFNEATAMLFVFGNLSVLVGGILSVMGNLGMIPFTLYYLFGGIVIQLFVFTLALSFRFRQNLLDTQEAQHKLIAQLKTNEELQLKVNKELEDKVRERTAEIAQQNEEIETQNEELLLKSTELEKTYTKITDSVRYAQRLQSAILGDEMEILKHFSDGFILFMPRDVVSGDFYWSSKIGHLRILIAADCTGHGIPGALMTILGSSILNDVINEETFFRLMRFYMNWIKKW